MVFCGCGKMEKSCIASSDREKLSHYLSSVPDYSLVKEALSFLATLLNRNDFETSLILVEVRL